METGLSPKTIQALAGVFGQFKQIDKVMLYGSRAMGTHKPGSDIDLALVGKDLSTDLLATIAVMLDDLLLPYTLDLTIYAFIDNSDLRAHIDRVAKEGVLFTEWYGQQSSTAGRAAFWQSLLDLRVKPRRSGRGCKRGRRKLPCSGLWFSVAFAVA